MKHLRYIRWVMLTLMVAIAFQACKSTEKLSETRIRSMSPSRLLQNIEEQVFDFSHFSVRRINLQVDDGNSKNAFRASMQAIKDEQIQFTITKFNIPLGRMMLTPDSLLFINYIDRTYLADDYTVLSDMLDFELGFNVIQTILSGNIFSFFEDDSDLLNYNATVEENMYKIQSEKFRKIRKIDEKGKVQKLERLLKRLDEDALVINTFYFDPVLFVLRRLELNDKTNMRSVALLYDEYQKVNDRYFPGSIDLLVQSEESSLRLDAKMSGFSTEKSDLVPLRIPERYRQLLIQ